VPFLSSERAWPRRHGDADSVGHGVVVALDVKPTLLAMRQEFLPSSRRPAESDLADLAALLGATAAGSTVRAVPEGPNAIVFERVRKRARSGIGVGPGPDAGPFGGLVFKVVSGQEREPADGGPRRIELERTWFAWYDALDAEGSPRPEGATRAALVMPGLFGNPEPVIDRLVQHLRRRGYGVLRMLAQPSRFTQRAEFVIDVEDLGASAARIAAVLGDRTAECAYAVESAWEFVESERREIRGVTKVAIGMSGGAMTLPTVCARNPGRYGAAVMIGGTADFWLTNERSNYRAMVDAVRVRWSAEPTDRQRAELDREYLAASPLDSFHTAAVLRGRRVLMLQGTIDLAAPSALGDILWERCGRPERWTYPVGHELLFAGLPQEFERVTAWLDTATGPGGGAASAESAR